MGAGAVAASGLIIFSAPCHDRLRVARRPQRCSRRGAGQAAPQLALIESSDADGSARSIVIVAMIWVLLTFHQFGAETRWYQNMFAGVFVVVFGFLFVTVAGRISGLLGNSSNPISGMSIATLMATCAIFFVADGRRRIIKYSR